MGLSCGLSLLVPCAQTVGVARPSDFDEHVAAAKLFGRADDLVRPIEKALR